MSTRGRWLVRAFALGGLGFAGAAAYVHYRLLTDPTYVSPCDVNATFNCSQVYLSRFGSVAGVSVAVGGVIWFALVSLIAWLGFPASAPATAKGVRATSQDDVAGSYLFALATIGLATILYLGFASYQLRTVCLLCVGVYACVIGIFVTTGLTASGRVARLPFRLLEDLRSMSSKPLGLIVAILFVVGSASAVAFFPKEAGTGATSVAADQAPPPTLSKDAEASFRQAWAAQPRVDLGIPAGMSKVVVVKFNDWLCPSCRAMHIAYQPTLDKYQKEMPGAVKYVVKDFLWNTRCNPASNATIQGHEGSCEAAAAVRMARDVGKGEAMIQWLFDNQMRLSQMSMGAPNNSDSAVAKAIKAQVMTMGILDFDKQYPVKLKEILKDASDGAALAVHSTPTYYVNGVKINDAQGNNLPIEYFDLALKIETTKSAGK